MKTKSILALSLALVLTLSAMTGCKKNEGGSTSSGTSSENSSVASSEVPKAESGQLNTAYEALLEGTFGEEAPRFMLMEDTTQIKEVTGIDFSNEAVKEYIYSTPMINSQFQIFAGIEAVDGKVKEAEEILTTYRDKVLADKEAFPYVDAGLEKAKAAKVITVDDYVFYICMANPEYKDGEGITQEMVDAEIEKSIKIVEEALKK